MKILNLYAGIGGNRKLWGTEHEVTAVESEPSIADVYAKNFPKDKVLVTDAHDFLLENYKNYDFIWSSPPCQSHSSFRHNICVRYRGTKPVYPDMKLWQEIIFLKHHATSKWVVENVKPYYQPLIKPDFVLQRHYFWANFNVLETEWEPDYIRTAQIPDLEKKHGFSLQGTTIKNKRQVLRNIVSPELGNHIFLSMLTP